jgi:hypothetical protein
MGEGAKTGEAVVAGDGTPPWKLSSSRIVSGGVSNVLRTRKSRLARPPPLSSVQRLRLRGLLEWGSSPGALLPRGVVIAR